MDGLSICIVMKTVPDPQIIVYSVFGFIKDLDQDHKKWERQGSIDMTLVCASRISGFDNLLNAIRISSSS